MGQNGFLSLQWLLWISTSVALSAAPGTVSSRNRPPRNLWDYWSSFLIPVKQTAGISWDGRTLWVLDSATKMICCLGAQGRIVTRLPLGGNVVYRGLAFHGKAFWTWNHRKKCFLSITTSGKRKEIPWSQPPPRSSLEGVGGKLIFISTDTTKISCIDTSTKQPAKCFSAPCRPILDMTWDGRYLWCLHDPQRDQREILVAYDTNRQLAFTAVPLKECAQYVAFGGGTGSKPPQTRAGRLLSRQKQVCDRIHELWHLGFPRLLRTFG